VKTRLIGGAVTRDRAAQVYGAFLRDMTTRLDGSDDYDLLLAWARDGDDDEIPDLGVPGFLQQGRDLGERMYRALANVGERYDDVVVLGSDHPDLPAARARQAVAWLRDGAEAVIGPSRDGGYYLLGLPADGVDESLFSGIDWSTERVLDQTLARFEDRGVTPRMLPAAADVDRPEDLRALHRRLEENVTRAPQTLAVLRSWTDWEDRT
jgi:rSAM/selenodomain-associated transferase 1